MRANNLLIGSLIATAGLIISCKKTEDINSAVDSNADLATEMLKCDLGYTVLDRGTSTILSVTTSSVKRGETLRIEDPVSGRELTAYFDGSGLGIVIKKGAQIFSHISARWGNFEMRVSDPVVVNSSALFAKYPNTSPSEIKSMLLSCEVKK